MALRHFGLGNFLLEEGVLCITRYLEISVFHLLNASTIFPLHLTYDIQMSQDIVWSWPQLRTTGKAQEETEREMAERRNMWTIIKSLDIYLSNHSYIKQTLSAKYVPATVLGAVDLAVNKTDKNIWPHAAYILVRGINNKQ